MSGFEQAHISRPGYAIEYDYFDPRDLTYSLQTKALDVCFVQINGTTGYEEAGAQVSLAGINAALKVQGQAFWEPRRDEAYIGVLVDDLINSVLQNRIECSPAEQNFDCVCDKTTQINA